MVTVDVIVEASDLRFVRSRVRVLPVQWPYAGDALRMPTLSREHGTFSCLLLELQHH